MSRHLSYNSRALISKIKFQKKHEHNLVYKVDCPDCDVSYIGESGRRLEERIMDHAGRDKYSHVLKHSLVKGHKEISLDNVTIISKNYKNYYNRKVSKALFIKTKKPILNTQDDSVPLKLFN